MQWINDSDVTARTLIGDFPLTRLAEEDYFNNAMSADSKDVNFACETLDGEHIGMTGIIQVDYRRGVGSTGSLIGRKDLWGQGYGTDSIRVGTRHAFDVPLTGVGRGPTFEAFARRPVVAPATGELNGSGR